MTLDPYTWLKALHVAAAMIFVSGVLGVAMFLNAAGSDDADLARKVRGWDQQVTTPAMLLVWALGLSLGLMGEWFRNGWLIAKLVFVIALSGMHGVQSAKLRQMAGGISAAPASSLSALLTLGTAFYLISIALKTLAVSVVYPVWAGSGTVGVALVGVLTLRESLSVRKVAGEVLVVLG